MTLDENMIPHHIRSEDNSPIFIVVGANGPIGQSFCRLINDLKLPLLELSHSPRPYQIRYNFLLDYPEVLNLMHDSKYIIIFCSGYSSIDLCSKNIELSHQFNIVSTKALLDYFQQFNSTLVFLSTDYVFNGTKPYLIEKKCDFGYNENDPTYPINIYGRQKLAIEIFIRDRFDKYIILRTSKILSLDKSCWLMQQIWKLSCGEKVFCFSDRIYAPVFLDDISRFTLESLEKEQFGTFHLAQDCPLSPFSQSMLIAQHIGLDTHLIIPTSLKSRTTGEPIPLNTMLNNRKSKSAFEFVYSSFDDFAELVSCYYHDIVLSAAGF